MERISRDQMFHDMAELVARRSTCLRGNVGCVLVNDRRVVSMGYNGSPPGMDECLDVGCLEIEGVEGCTRTIHAEANALIFAARMGIPTAGCFMYATHSPCLHCAMLAKTAGVTVICYDKEYRATPWELLTEMQIEMRGWDGTGKEYVRDWRLFP